MKFDLVDDLSVSLGIGMCMLTLAAEHWFHHVYDSNVFEFPFGKTVSVPGSSIGITKFMVLQLISAALVFFIYRGLVKRTEGGQVVSGWFWNFWEMLAVYLRDQVVRPIIGDPDHHDHDHGAKNPALAMDHHGHIDDQFHAKSIAAHAVKAHPADRFLPYIWTTFFFVLFCNLLGAVPWAGSATGSISVTAALALIAFGVNIYCGSKAHGVVGFWTNMVPPIDAPAALKPILVGLLFVIEVAGLFIKQSVLAVRLFANIMGGHAALAVLLVFIAMAQANISNSALYGVVLGGSLIGQIGVGLLELLVAFLQAYVFSFLATIFISSSMHGH